MAKQGPGTKTVVRQLMVQAPRRRSAPRRRARRRRSSKTYNVPKFIAGATAIITLLRPFGNTLTRITNYDGNQNNAQSIMDQFVIDSKVSFALPNLMDAGKPIVVYGAYKFVKKVAGVGTVRVGPFTA